MRVKGADSIKVSAFCPAGGVARTTRVHRTAPSGSTQAEAESEIFARVDERIADAIEAIDKYEQRRADNRQAVREKVDPKPAMIDVELNTLDKLLKNGKVKLSLEYDEALKVYAAYVTPPTTANAKQYHYVGHDKEHVTGAIREAVTGWQADVKKGKVA
jgi:hypothetical protein